MAFSCDVYEKSLCICRCKTVKNTIVDTQLRYDNSANCRIRKPTANSDKSAQDSMSNVSALNYYTSCRKEQLQLLLVVHTTFHLFLCSPAAILIFKLANNVVLLTHPISTLLHNRNNTRFSHKSSLQLHTIQTTAENECYASRVLHRIIK